MPNVINGTSTGSGGLITSGDDSGILNIQTNEVTAITVDASQNIGVGVTPSAWGSSMRAIQIGTLGSFHQNDAGSFYGSRNSYNSSSGYKYLTTSTAQLFGPESNGGFAWYQAASGTAGNAITWTQAMTLDSSGNLLVGTTSGSGNNERLNITTNTNQTARFINTNATSGNISIVSTLGANTDNTSSYHILTATNGATRFYVYGNGTSGNASDKNLKKNIETTRDGYAEDLCKLRVVKYNWNDQADGSPKELGWIAQEVEQVFPNLVQDGIPNEKGETFKEVKTSVLPFMLLKAIQEQQAIIETLTQRITALEGA